MSEPTVAIPPLGGRVRIVLADDHDLVEVQRLQPDLVVTDLSMPGTDGLTAITALRGMVRPPRVLVVSMHDSPDIIRRALQLGAAGYIVKENSPLELEHAVRNVMAGRPYYSAQVALQFTQTHERSPKELLTGRQLQILALIARGQVSKEIGYALHLSPKTVDRHRARIMHRLGINDLPRLTLYCVRHGLVDAVREV